MIISLQQFKRNCLNDVFITFDAVDTANKQKLNKSNPTEWGYIMAAYRKAVAIYDSVKAL